MRLELFTLFVALAASSLVQNGKICSLHPEGVDDNGEGLDDSPNIHKAFENCGHDGKVIFEDGVFHINSVLNTTNLANCDVSLRGELRWSTDIEYWKENVFSVVFQNQSTGWLFGGENVTFRGEGGWYNGNGQAWYTQNRNESNQFGRPISITVFDSRNVLIDNLTIIGPQFWATYVWKSKDVSITNFVSNATSNDEWSVVNTDGFDSWNSDNILIENATITTMDDCIAAKGNTTNLHVKNVTCDWTNGVTIGSVGQYPEWPDYVENVLFEDIKCVNSRNCAYIKTWTGHPEDSDAKDSGGGRGHVRNITFRDIEVIDTEHPLQITQCIYQEGGGECGTSKMKIEDVLWKNITGTSTWNIAASFSCAESNPCENLHFEDVDLKSVNETLGLPNWNTTIQHQVYQCAYIDGEDETGIPCNREAPPNFPQHPDGNIREDSIA